MFDDRRIVSGIIYVIKHGLMWREEGDGRQYPRPFMEKVEEMDATMKMKYGTYKIPQGSSAEQIINILM